MRRTSIRQFRASLAGDAEQTPLMRAYRKLARRPTAIGGRVGVEWPTWPPAAAGARAFADWPVWNEARQETAGVEAG